MTKHHLVKELAERLNVSQIKARELIQWYLDGVVDMLLSSGKLRLENLGVLEIHHRKERTARNPLTGGAVRVRSKNIIRFRPTDDLEDRVERFGRVHVKPTTRNRGNPATHLLKKRKDEDHGSPTT